MERIQNHGKKIQVYGFDNKVEYYRLDGEVFVKKTRRKHNWIHQIFQTILENLGIIFTFSKPYPNYVSPLQASFNEDNRRPFPLSYLDYKNFPNEGLLIEKFLADKTLDQFLAGCKMEEIRRLGSKLGREMAELHGKGFTLGDNKARNIIISKKREIIHTDYERSAIMATEYRRNLDVATLTGSLCCLPRKIFEPFCDEFLSSYTKHSGKVMWRTMMMRNLRALFHSPTSLPSQHNNGLGECTIIFICSLHCFSGSSLGSATLHLFKVF